MIVRLCLLWLCLVGVSVAQESDLIIVSQYIQFEDATAPTIPGDLAATPVSFSEIQLSWTASTDNVAVAGYRLWRDGVAVATTTNTVYVDFGLATSTTYAYYVTAFDGAGNESASSSVIVSATDDLPTQSANTHAGVFLGGGTITDLDVSVSENTMTVTVDSNRLTRAHLSWIGTNGMSGSVVSDALTRTHTLFIDGIAADTEYELSLTLFVDDRFPITERTFTVRTLPEPDTQPPPNVTNLTATETETGAIVLQWNNPAVEDFSRVRIVRSSRWYPLDPVDGWVVYESEGQRYVDPYQQRPVYYTVFSIDTSGNQSSGAVIAWLENADTRDVGGDTTQWEVGATSSPMFSSSSTVPLPPDFTTVRTQVTWSVYVVQNDTVSLIGENSRITLHTNTPFSVRIPAVMVSENLKTIIGTIAHPDPTVGTFRFLLRREANGEYYQATIGSLPDRGQYRLSVQWLDFVTKTSGIAEGDLVLAAVLPPAPPAAFSGTMLPPRVIAAGMLLFLVFVMLRIFWRRVLIVER